MRLIRSIIFFIGMVLSICLWVVPCVIARLFPYKVCFAIVSSWCTFNVKWLRLTCGINYEITGIENIPDRPCVIMSNHQSTWETLAFPAIFPTLTWVIKRELLFIPLFGWGIASTQPIALNRKQGRSAFKQLIKDGKEKLGLGRFILIFPEGTRIPYNEERELKIGGFVLAKKAKADILPVAHDAGRLWPRKGFVKTPGTIHLHIGKPICTQENTTEELRQQYSTWLSSTREEIKLKQSR